MICLIILAVELLPDAFGPEIIFIRAAKSLYAFIPRSKPGILLIERFFSMKGIAIVVGINNCSFC
jgi:hypothetical protein